MPTIYISPTNKETYYKVTGAPKAWGNIGIIELDGTLNVKLELREMIRRAGGDFSKAPGFTPAKNGKTHGVGGTGFNSYAKFPDRKAAAQYQEKFFRVTYLGKRKFFR